MVFKHNLKTLQRSHIIRKNKIIIIKINGSKILKNSFYFHQTEISPSDSIEENANNYDFFPVNSDQIFQIDIFALRQSI